jgi:hypothetical protein
MEPPHIFYRGSNGEIFDVYWDKWSVFDNVVIFVFFLIDLEDDIRTLDLVMLLQQVED